MGQREVEQARHALEKGKMLEILRDGYGGPAVMISQMAGALDALGFPMSRNNLQFSLSYLADCEYIKVVRAQEVPGYRRDRLREGDTPETIVMAKLQPLGLRLIDGTAQEDPQVRF